MLRFCAQYHTGMAGFACISRASVCLSVCVRGCCDGARTHTAGTTAVHSPLLFRITTQQAVGSSSRLLGAMTERVQSRLAWQHRRRRGNSRTARMRRRCTPSYRLFTTSAYWVRRARAASNEHQIKSASNPVAVLVLYLWHSAGAACLILRPPACLPSALR